MKNRWEKTANEKSKQCAQRKLHECFWICVCIQFGTYANGEKKVFSLNKIVWLNFIWGKVEVYTLYWGREETLNISA